MDRRCDLTEDSRFTTTDPRLFRELRDLVVNAQIVISEEDLENAKHDLESFFGPNPPPLDYLMRLLGPITGNKVDRISKLVEMCYNTQWKCERCGADLWRRCDAGTFGLCRTCMEDMEFGRPQYRRVGWEGAYKPPRELTPRDFD